ncbi:MAG TPA: polymer-forming cytoskeletal protein [Candidatus Acidoferrales bacterium]|nr:polymer-forming cytoskeletal protein [Candidatus Acidoferrales bacterium]
MPLSWFDRKKLEKGEWTGFLAPGVRFEGKIETTGTFRVDAMVKGSLHSDEMLVLGEDAVMQGEIAGSHVRVAGRFGGGIRARERVDIQANAVVTGEIHTRCLVIESGAIFDGNCHIDPGQPAKPMTISIRSAVAAKPVET